MKFIVVVFISILLTVSLGTLTKLAKFSNKQNLVSPLVAGTNTSETESNRGSSDMGWQVFVNNYYGYKIKHPSDIKIVNKTNGDVSLEKSKSINIYISQDVLDKMDNLNTVIENAIGNKRLKLNENYTLINNISPIAMGNTTAETYTVREGDKIVSYYFIPQSDGKYLIVTNASPPDGSADYIVSENIIYSLELLP